MGRPYAFEVDDSDTFGPWLCKDHDHAERRRAEGKRVVALFADPRDLEAPTRDQRQASESAQRILRDAEAMAALRRLRRLAGVGEGVSLAGVVDVIEQRINPKSNSK